jgi:hypothetical protein
MGGASNLQGKPVRIDSMLPFVPSSDVSMRVLRVVVEFFGSFRMTPTPKYGRRIEMISAILLASALSIDGGCIGKPWMPPPTSLHFAPDFTGDCVVQFDDLIIILSQWGTCEDQARLCGCPIETYCCRTDLDRNGITDLDDVIAVLTAMSLEW